MKNGTNLFLLFVLIAILFGVYFWYTSFSERGVSVETEQLTEEEVARRDFLALINKVRTINLDVDFFKDNKFISLEDFVYFVETPEEAGKINPFLRF